MGGLDAFKAFQQNVEEHARIKRVVGRCIASIEKATCDSREIVSESRELLAQADKQLGSS